MRTEPPSVVYASSSTLSSMIISLLLFAFAGE